MMKLKITEAFLMLLLTASFLVVPASGYTGTSNCTSASVDDSRVDPSASVSWTVGPILNATGGPIGTGNSSLTFDGVDDYVSCSDDASLDGILAVEAWVYISADRPDTGPDFHIIATKHSTYKGGLYVSQVAGADSFIATFENGTDISQAAYNISAYGAWYHVVAQINTTTDRAELYVNGVYRGQGDSVPNLSVNNGEPFRVAGGIADRYFNDTVDEVRAYNRSLTPSEVAEHYQGIYSNETGLVLYLDFDGNVNDRSGEGNNGVVNGDPAYSDGWANCPVSSSYNGTGGTTVGLVNSTTGLATIPCTAPATAGNYTVTLSGNNSVANYTYTGFIVDSYHVNVYSLYSETEEDFYTLLYADGESIIDGHQLTSGDTLTIEGISFTWNTYTSRFEATDSETTPQTKTYNTLTTLNEANYSITSGSINTTATVTWTQGTMDRLQTDFMTGDWVNAILGEYIFAMGELFFWTTLMTILSVGIYNVGGAYTTILAWVLGWGVFTEVIHGQAQIIGYIFILIAVAVALVKLALDRRTT